MKPKSKGSGIMVSNFIEEHSGFLALNDEEYERAKAANPNAKKYAKEFWNMEKVERVTGLETSSFSKSRKQLKWQSLSTLSMKDGAMLGSLTIAAVMLLWQTTPWMP